MPAVRPLAVRQPQPLLLRRRRSRGSSHRHDANLNLSALFAPHCMTLGCSARAAVQPLGRPLLDGQVVHAAVRGQRRGLAAACAVPRLLGRRGAAAPRARACRRCSIASARLKTCFKNNARAARGSNADHPPPPGLKSYQGTPAVSNRHSPPPVLLHPLASFFRAFLAVALHCRAPPSHRCCKVLERGAHASRAPALVAGDACARRRAIGG